MALTTKKVINDTASVVVHSMRKEFNDLLTAIDTSTDYASLMVNIRAACTKIATTIELPAPPTGPIV